MFEPHKLNKDQIKPIRDFIIVQDMVFDMRTLSSGIIVPNDDSRTAGIRPRWAQVYAVGPDQAEVNPGDWVMVAHGRWTRGVKIQDETGEHTIRRIDPEGILLISDEQQEDDSMSTALLQDSKERW